MVFERERFGRFGRFGKFKLFQTTLNLIAQTLKFRLWGTKCSSSFAKLTVRDDRLLFRFAIPTVELNTATAGQQHLPVHLDRRATWRKTMNSINFYRSVLRLLLRRCESPWSRKIVQKALQAAYHRIVDLFLAWEKIISYCWIRKSKRKFREKSRLQKDSERTPKKLQRKRKSNSFDRPVK